MATDSINIGYGGALQHYDPDETSPKNSWLKRTFWEYRPENINHHVRSAYYLFSALSRFKIENPKSAERIHIHLWGKIDPMNHKLAEKLNIQELVHFSGLLNKESNLKKLDEMDLLFLPLEVGIPPNKSLFIPGKVYEYILLRKPILVIGGDSDALELVKESGLGFQFAFDNLTSLLKFFEQIVKDKKSLSVNPNNELIESKSFTRLTTKLSNVFDELLHK